MRTIEQAWKKSMQQILNLRDMQMIERVHARGGKFRYYPLLAGKEGSTGNFFLQLSNTFDDFDSPRHRHNFDQIRVQLEGVADFSRDGKMSPGMIGYFPEGVYYGPQSLAGESLTLVLQFGGASRSGYLSEDEFQRGIVELKQHGSFEQGIYRSTRPDGRPRNQDAYEAVWEHVHGRELHYPQSRYDKPVFMHPDAADWSVQDMPAGVACRHLGTFSEARTTLSQFRMESGARLSVPRNTVIFVLSGQGSTGAEGYWEARSSLYSGAQEGTLVAKAASELLSIELPQV